MTTFLALRAHPFIISPIPEHFRGSSSLSLQRSSLTFPNQKPLKIRRGSLGVVRFGHDFDGSDGTIQHLFGRVEGLLYTLADAAVSASETVDGVKQKEDWFTGITNLMETVLKVLKDGISTLHAPYAYGFAIILLTVIVKAATFPLTKKQVESSLAMRSLQPQVKAIQQRYAGDAEKIQIETARLYKLAGVNPLAGCLPTLATIPVWIGLYRALSNVADEGLLTEGFFWIPSLAGPTTIASRQNGSGISWLFPFIDGHPPLGWSDTLAYLVLPVLLVISQYISVQIMQSSQPQSNDPNMKTSQAITKFIPLMIGYFSLSVPSGLSLYWLTNNILSTAQQVWLQKLGGAKVMIRQLSDDTVKEEEQKIQKPVIELSKTKEIESRQGEKSSSEGLRPGERFKMLKEQEARKKQQREEEKRKAEESVNGNVIASGEHNKEVKFVTHENETDESKFVDAGDEGLQSETVVHGSTKTGVLSVNGSTKDPDNNQENVPLSSSDHAKKEEELQTIKATTGIVVSDKDAQQDRTDQQGSRREEA